MKFSLTSSLLILAIGGAMGFMHHQRWVVLEDDHRHLVEKATGLGIDVASAMGSPERKITKRQREKKEVEVSVLTAELVAFAKEMADQRESSSDPGETVEERSAELMNRLMELDPAMLKLVIAGLCDDKSLPEESRRSMIGFSIMILAESHPAAALALYSEIADLLGDGIIGQELVSSSLRLWAKDNPQAAVEWIRQNESAHPDLTDDETKQNIIAGAALTDPKLAFQLIGEMHVEDASAAIETVVESATTPDQRTAVLAALRDHLATLPEGSERDDLFQEALESLGRNLADESFDKVRAWIVDSKLSQKEAGQFAAGLSYFNTKEDSGHWIDWMGEKLSEGDARECADNLIGQWTQQDYLAAGQWLAAAPASAAKEASVATYAETVAEYEPQVAVQWALTLPEGELRIGTLQSIYQNWPQSDAAAAAEFARQYGVDTAVER